MKAIFTFTCLLVVTFTKVFAQNHFISAGQTQRMIITDFYPDTLLFHLSNIGNLYRYIDINGDSIPDIKFHYHLDVHTGGRPPEQVHYNQTQFVSVAMTPNVKFACSIDTAKGIYGWRCGATSGTKPYFNFNKLYLFNDPIVIDEISDWCDSSYISFNIYSSSCYCGCRGGYPLLNDSSYYIAGKYSGTNDTLLFYIHLGKSNYRLYVRDYAIENPLLFPDKIGTVFPNPFTTQLNVASETPFQYLLIDYLGRTVMYGISEKTIETTHLPSGIYVLVVKNDEMFATRKVMKL